MPVILQKVLSVQITTSAVALTSNAAHNFTYRYCRHCRAVASFEAQPDTTVPSCPMPIAVVASCCVGGCVIENPSIILVVYCITIHSKIL